MVWRININNTAPALQKPNVFKMYTQFLTVSREIIDSYNRIKPRQVSWNDTKCWK